MKQDRILAAALFAVLAFFGLSSRSDPGGTRPETAKKAESKDSEDKPSQRPVWPIVDAIHVMRLACEARGKPAGCEDCVVPRLLIATVPHPRRSGIPALFDSAIESIQRAVAESGYVLFRAAVEAVADGGTGTMTFRKSEGDLLVVLLVGETPMAGVDRVAFRSAIQTFRMLHGEAVARVLGPTFSGSIGPLAAELAAAAGRIRFVSGTATRAANRAEIIKVDPARIEYESAAENDTVTMQALLEFLESRGVPPASVAMLAEAGTTFGRALVAEDRHSRSPGLTAEFPMQISRLRAAYQNNPSLRGLWSPGQDSGGPRLTATEVTGNERPPSFAKDQTAMELELGVAELAAGINRAGIQVAIIGASDEADILFLAKMLQRFSPNVRLAALDADLIYLHTTPELSYAGLMMVTPYPLWLPNQTAARNGPRRLQPFTSRAAQGVFNAARMLLEDSPERRGLIEFRHPLRFQPFPPVWVTIVGGGDVWPLAILDAPKGTESSLETASEPRRGLWEETFPEPPWSGWFLLLFGITCLISGWTMWNYYRFCKGDGPVFTPFELPEHHTSRRTALIGVLVGSGLVLFGQFLAVLSSPHAGCGFFVSSLRVIAVAMVAASILLGWIGGPSMVRLTKGMMVFVVAYYGWLWISTAGDASVALPFVARSLMPFTGVDPLTPQIFVWFGLVWWAAVTLHRARIAELRDPGNPFANDKTPRLAGDFDEVLEWVNDKRWKLLLVPAAASLTILAGSLGTRWNMGLEPLVWRVTFAAGFVALFGLCAAAATRLVRISCAVTDALRPLSWMRLGQAFERLDKDIAVRDMWARGSRRFPFESENYSIELLEKAAAMGVPGDFHGCHALAVRSLEACRDAGRSGARMPTDQAIRLSEALREIGGGFASDIGLEDGSKGSVVIPKGDRPRDKRIREAIQLKEEYLALRVVAIVNYAVLHMRLLLEFLTLAAVSLFLAILSYPFQPQTVLINAASLLALACGVAAVFVLYQLDQNEILRKLRKPGEKEPWTESFYAKAIIYGLLPLLAALANRFPGALRKFGDLIEPLTKLASG